LRTEKRKAIYLFGGLGNQLFQVARGLSMLKQGDQLECLYDKTVTRTLCNGFPELSLYKLEPRIIFKEVHNSIVSQKIINLGIRISTGNLILVRRKGSARIIRFGVELLIGLTMKMRFRVRVADNVGQSENLRGAKNELLIGYSQSFQHAEELKRFENLERIKLELISEKAQKLITASNEANPIIMHVRLGDYTKEPNFGLLAPNYFLRALDLAEFKGRKGQIWIFSNDPQRARALLNIGSEPRFLVIDDQELNPAEVLEIMRHGSAYILSNSTFGWWGAFLSHTIDAPVVVPQKWFKKYPDPLNIYPPSWVTFSPQDSLFLD
jgi:hypothetical protein